MTQPNSTFAITNVRAVLPDTIEENATVFVDGDVITSVSNSRSRVPGAIDGHGLLLLPGLVDSHSDGLEKEVAPRRTTRFDLDFALQSFESRCRAAGITTVFHGVGYQHKPDAGRTVERARDVRRAVARRADHEGTTVDHRVLSRFEARDPDSLEPLLDDLEHECAISASAPLLSFEDHTPGQGQYRDPAQFAAAIDPATLPPGTTADQHVEGLMAEAAELLEVRHKNLARIEPLATNGSIRLLAHDAETATDIAEARQSGATIAEFPLTVEAASAARREGMQIVMGAPNGLRGISHSGNASARELVSKGLCDVLASDYMPTTMLAAAFAIAAEGCCSLSAAIALVTAGPARMAGLDDRGALRPGARADVILIDDRGPWPQVVYTHRAGDRRLAMTGAR